MPTVKAFLVGVDRYLGPVNALHGCFNDVVAAETWLRARAAATGDAVEVHRLVDEQATRERFIVEFREFFAGSERDQQLLLYCSMHGAQQRTAPEFVQYEYDGLDETLVFHDSRAEGGRDLADKELGVLVDEAVAGGARMTVILDSCHSGSGVRGVADDVGVRLTTPDLRDRTLADYLDGTAALLAARPEGQRGAGNYVLLAACAPHQLAKEVTLDGVTRGAMSAALEQVLRGGASPLTNAAVQRAVSAAVRNRVDDQTPQLECPQPTSASEPFLGAGAAATAPLFTMSHLEGRWQVDAGAVHGLPLLAPAGSDPAELDLFDLRATDLSPAHALATAQVSSVHSTTSDVTLVTGTGLSTTLTYRAVFRRVPAASVTVRVAPEVRDVPGLLTAVAEVVDVRVVDGDAELEVGLDGARIVVRRAGSTRPVAAGHDIGPRAVAAVVDDVARIGRWMNLMALHNPAAGSWGDAVTLDLLPEEGEPFEVEDDAVVVPLTREGVDWMPRRVQVRVRNTTERTVHVQVLALTERCGVQPLLEIGSVRLGPGDETFAKDDAGKPVIRLTLPAGLTRTTDVFKLIVTTTPFDVASLRQDELVPPTRDRGDVTGARGVDLRSAPDVPTAADAWYARDLVVVTQLPSARATVPTTGGAPVTIADGVVVEPHPTLRASVALTTSRDGARSAAVPLVPPALALDDASQAFGFLASRAPGDELDVLEIVFDDEDETALPSAAGVTPEAPLVLRVARPLEAGAAVLPIMFDGRDYLPVGTAAPEDDHLVVRIQRLPTSDIGLRSLGGSLKILFRKLVLRPLGVTYDWPRLSLVTYQDGEPVYTHDVDEVRRGLRDAHSVLLLVHGIIGDTVGMAHAVGPGATSLATGYDAVLAYDYENIHTHIAANGESLAGRLGEVGVVAGDDGIRVTALVHSMGGLVTRCFIEQYGGAAVVERLVTCGTPHHGSPWPRIEDYALASVGLLLNHVLDATGPGAVVGKLLGFATRIVEKVDNALDDMNPGSPLIGQLAGHGDPGVPYATIRGTLPWPNAADDAAVARILGKLLRYGFDTVFHQEPNDMAVSVASASAVGAAWPTPPQRLDAACNHISYFSSEQGLAAIRQALPPAG